MSKAEILERESRWALPVALVTMAAVILFVGSTHHRHDHDQRRRRRRTCCARSTRTRAPTCCSGILRAARIAAPLAPLLYLFRAAEARNPAVRSQLIGVIWVTAAVHGGRRDLLDPRQPRRGLRVRQRGHRGQRRARRRGGDRPDQGGIAAQRRLGPLAGGRARLRLHHGLHLPAGDEGGAAQPLLGIAGDGPRRGLLHPRPVHPLRPALVRLLRAAGRRLGPRRPPPAWAEGKAVPWPTPGEEAAERVEQEPPEAEEGEPASPWEDNGRERPNPPRQRGERKKRKRRE